MAYAITLIPGDGIGPSVVGAARDVIERAGVAVDWDLQQVGAPALERSGDPLPPPVLASIRANGVALKGPVATPIGTRGFRSVNVALRRELDLFAQVRPSISRPGPHRSAAGLDLTVIRDTTEDLYAGIELEVASEGAAAVGAALARHGGRSIPADAGLSIKFLSRAASARIAAFAFDYARRGRRARVTAVHKASVMRCTDGLFLEEARRVAAAHPGIAFDDQLVDNLCGQLVRRGAEYDVLVMPNMYGDIVSDLAAALTGGVGLAPGANYGPDAAVFEPAHGSAPRHAGANSANPAAAILSGAMLLEHLGEQDAAARVRDAVGAAIAEGSVTCDLKADREDPTALGTDAFAARVLARL